MVTNCIKPPKPTASIFKSVFAPPAFIVGTSPASPIIKVVAFAEVSTICKILLGVAVPIPSLSFVASQNRLLSPVIAEAADQ